MSRSTYYPFKSASLKEEYLAYYHKTECEFWPVPFTDKVIKTTYGQTLVRLSGPKNAPPLVLLPGITATSLMWYPNVEAWCKNYRVYAIDTINDYGLSINTRTMWRGKDYVAWLADLFAHLGFKTKINLLGMSYGGWLTALYAAAYPEKLNKIILIAPGGTVFPIQTKFLLVLAGIFFLPYNLVEKLLIKWVGGDKTANAGIGDDISNFVQCLLRGLSHFQKRFIALPSVFSSRQWQALRVQTLFMIGEKEKMYPADLVLKHLRTVAPQVQTALIPGVGHDLTFLQATLVNKVVVDFLQKS